MLMCVVKMERGCNLNAMRFDSREFFDDEETPSKKEGVVGKD